MKTKLIVYFESDGPLENAGWGFNALSQLLKSGESIEAYSYGENPYSNMQDDVLLEEYQTIQKELEERGI